MHLPTGDGERGTQLMRVNNKGEGGVLALSALARRTLRGTTARWAFLAGLVGMGLFCADGVIARDHVVGLPHWQKRLLGTMHRTAAKSADFFRLPPGQVIHLGTEVSISPSARGVAEQAARDDQPLDLAGALINLGDLRIAVVPLGVVLP